MWIRTDNITQPDSIILLQFALCSVLKEGPHIDSFCFSCVSLGSPDINTSTEMVPSQHFYPNLRSLREAIHNSPPIRNLKASKQCTYSSIWSLACEVNSYHRSNSYHGYLPRLLAITRYLLWQNHLAPSASLTLYLSLNKLSFLKEETEVKMEHICMEFLQTHRLSGSYVLSQGL